MMDTVSSYPKQLLGGKLWIDPRNGCEETTKSLAVINKDLLYIVIFKIITAAAVNKNCM